MLLLKPRGARSLQTLAAATLLSIGGVSVSLADPGTAAGLAKRAEKARSRGQVERAYWLFGQAAAQDPSNPKYRDNRDALAPLAKLLETMHVDDGSEQPEEPNGETAPSEPLERGSVIDWRREQALEATPRLEPAATVGSFDLQGDERTVIQQVAQACGLRATFDPQLQSQQNVRFSLAEADCRTALQSVADATDTFAFPVSPKHFFVARNTEEKRNQYEPQTLLTLTLPNSLDQKDVQEAANAVRAVMNVRSIAWDSLSRTVMVKDRASRAQAILGLLEAVMLPRAEVSLEVEIVTLDSGRTYHYGLSLPTSFQGAFLGHIGGFQNPLSSGLNGLSLLTFGGGGSLFGLTLGDANLFATYTQAYSHALYDSTVRVTSGQTATFHVGQQYPIAQTLYTGFSQTNASIYNPVPQVQLVDLGVQLKMSPRVSGEGLIAMDIEAEYKTLGNVVLNTVPSIAQRIYKGSVSLHEGEWAVLAGLDSYSQTQTRTGLPGLTQIRGVNELFSENTRDRQTSQTLVLIKPTILRLPMSAAVSPQYLVGPQRGSAFLF